MGCEENRLIHTVGHSTRPLERFLELLTAHRVELLIDVRRWPSSKRFPHFNRDALSHSLEIEEIRYDWRGDLGGYRKPLPDSPNTGWRIDAFRAYADFMMTPAFDRIMGEVEALAAERRVSLMCAEAVPWRCHRQLLADAFLVRGWKVRHILDKGCEEHRLTPFAWQEGSRILYPAGNKR